MDGDRLREGQRERERREVGLKEGAEEVWRYIQELREEREG